MAVLSMLVLLFTGCNDGSDDVTLKLSVSRLEMSGEGASQSVDLKATGAWKATSSEGWCSVSPATGKGDAQLTITVRKNPSTTDKRKCNIILVSKNIGRESQVVILEQEPSEANIPVVDPSDGGDGNEGGGNSTTTYTITLSSSPSNGGMVTGGGTYASGKSVVLTATPASGYKFTKWSDGVTTNPRTLTVTSNKTITAYFEQNSSNPSTPVEVAKENGVLTGKFSVSATKKVQFAMGNLQYQASTDTWRFAENQYDVIGSNNKNISSTYSGWIDLFGWGTSGYNSKYPYMTSTDCSDYGNGTYDISGTNYDWGVYNAISNGGNKAGMWRTLTKSEWEYLFNTRTNAENLRGQATVNGQTGYILLPDGWSTPNGMTFTADPCNFTTNSYTASEWSKMEASGAVFLPAAGSRVGTTVGLVGKDGGYWSSTYFRIGNAYDFDFRSRKVNPSDYYSLINGLSVRLVQE